MSSLSVSLHLVSDCTWSQTALSVKLSASLTLDSSPQAACHAVGSCGPTPNKEQHPRRKNIKSDSLTLLVKGCNVCHAD